MLAASPSLPWVLFYFIFPFLLDSPSKNILYVHSSSFCLLSFLYVNSLPYTEPSSRLWYPFCISNGTKKHFWMINIFHYRQTSFALSRPSSIFWRKSKFLLWDDEEEKILYGLIEVRERRIYIITIANISIWKTAFYHQRTHTAGNKHIFSRCMKQAKSTKLNEHSHLYGAVDGLNSLLP